jgi:sulfatase maturation enzyme AslB (radical SAM superfamily)
MEWNTLRAVIDFLLESKRPQLAISFYGGEPLLEFPLIKRAIRYIESARAADLKIAYTVTTNGLLLDRDTARFLARHEVVTFISCDGVAAAQELRAPGSFERLDGVLRDVAETEPEFLRGCCRAAITLSSRNVGFLAESFDELVRRGVGEVAVSALVTHDPGWRPAHIDVLTDQMASVVATSLEHLKRTGDVAFTPFRPTEANGRPQRDTPSLCSAVNPKSLTVDVDGLVSRCVMLAESYQDLPKGPLGRGLEAMRLGDFRDADFDRRLAEFPSHAHAALIFDNKRDNYSSYRKCDGCRYLYQCSICPVSICHIPGNTDPNRIPDLQCAFNLAVLTARELFLREVGNGEAVESIMA